MCIAYWYVFLCTNNKPCFTRTDRVRVLSLISIFQENRSSSITLHLHIPINILAFNSGNQEQKPPPLLLSISTFPSTSSPSTPVTKNKSLLANLLATSSLLFFFFAVQFFSPPKQNTQKIIIPTPTTKVSNINFIFKLFHHMRFLNALPCLWKLSAWNLNASVLSTRTSIFSPRSKTFSMLSIMISFTSLTCCCTEATFVFPTAPFCAPPPPPPPLNCSNAIVSSISFFNVGPNVLSKLCAFAFSPTDPANFCEKIPFTFSKN